jgi:hypothetical protein
MDTITALINVKRGLHRTNDLAKVKNLIVFTRSKLLALNELDRVGKAIFTEAPWKSTSDEIIKIFESFKSNPNSFDAQKIHGLFSDLDQKLRPYKGLVSEYYRLSTRITFHESHSRNFLKSLEKLRVKPTTEVIEQIDATNTGGAWTTPYKHRIPKFDDFCSIITHRCGEVGSGMIDKLRSHTRNPAEINLALDVLKQLKHASNTGNILKYRLLLKRYSNPETLGLEDFAASSIKKFVSAVEPVLTPITRNNFIPGMLNEALEAIKYGKITLFPKIMGMLSEISQQEGIQITKDQHEKILSLTSMYVQKFGVEQKI